MFQLSTVLKLLAAQIQAYRSPTQSAPPIPLTTTTTAATTATTTTTTTTTTTAVTKTIFSLHSLLGTLSF